MADSLKGMLINVGGVVQGVGFRWFARRLAERFGVTGYVKNLYDGSVEILAEGNEAALKAFYEQIRLGPPHAHVALATIEWLEYKGQYNEFRIEL